MGIPAPAAGIADPTPQRAEPPPKRLPITPARRPGQLDRSRSWAVLDEERRVVRVSDLDLAAYLLAKNLALIDAFQVRERENCYDFWDPDGRITSLSIEFMNSPEARFADCVRRLKKASYSVPPGWDPFAIRREPR